MHVIKRVLVTSGLALVGLAGVLSVRASTMPSRQPPAADEVAEIALDERGIVDRFARALTFPTVSNPDRGAMERGAFKAFHEYLAASYPATHAALRREVVADMSLLYTWQGRDSSLAPVVLMGHMDVVPAGQVQEWTHPPFGGAVIDDVIWGRGALDNKINVISILEAVELLVTAGHQPARTIFLAFGHDEEVGGRQGAAAIADVLEMRGHSDYALVLDEGGALADGSMLGLPGTVAVIGIAEKGAISLELEVSSAGGHSSNPPEQTAIGILAAAIRRLEDNPFPATLNPATAAMLDWVGPELGFVSRLFVANRWLFGSLIARGMASNPISAAMVRTTTAATMIQGGVAANVLPQRATATVNHRIAPEETRETVLERSRAVIDDERVRVTAPGFAANPSPVSDPDSDAFRLLGTTLRQVHPDPDLIVTPYLVIGGTDARYYAQRSRFVFRFVPLRLESDGDILMHAIDERVSQESLLTAIRFFVRLIRNTDGLSR